MASSGPRATTISYIPEGVIELLWNSLARGAKAFSELWTQVQSQIRFEDIISYGPPYTIRRGHSTTTFLPCDQKGSRNLLLQLAKMAAEGESGPFLAVCKRFSAEISLEHLINTPQEGPHKGHSVLLYLFKSKDAELIQSLFSQLSGFLSIDLLNTLTSLAQYTLPNSLLNLINARNIFFSVLYNMQDANREKLNLSKITFDAHALGYHNAYYELAKYLSSQGEVETALKAYQQVPKQSWNYENVNTTLLRNEFRLIERNTSKVAKYHHLREALFYALNNPNTAIKNDAIQKIAAWYASDFATQPLGELSNVTIPEGWLMVMNSSKEIDWCLERIGEFAESIRLKRKNKKLEEELQQSKKEMAQLVSLNEMLKDQNALLKGQVKGLELEKEIREKSEEEMINLISSNLNPADSLTLVDGSNRNDNGTLGGSSGNNAPLMFLFNKETPVSVGSSTIGVATAATTPAWNGMPTELFPPSVGSIGNDRGNSHSEERPLFPTLMAGSSSHTHKRTCPSKENTKTETPRKRMYSWQ